MVDQESIQRHYKTREELKQIEHEDNARKSLIKLSILQVVTNNHFKSLQPVGRARRAKKPPVIPRKLVTPTNLSGEQLNEYEVAINNLKLEHSTTSKLQEARINALKEENMKLKTQVKDLKSSTSKPSSLNLGNGPFSIKSRTSTMVSPSLKVPSSFNKIGGPSIPPFNPLSVFDTIMTPVRKSKLTLNRPTRSKTEFSPPPVHSDTTTSTTVGFRSSSAVPSSPTRADISSSTPTKYMASFDKSENEGSSSPDFTPKRSKYKDKILADEAETSSFVSANSTLRGGHDTDTEKDTEKPRRSKRIRKPSKKLQLSKSKRTLGAKTGKNGANKLSHGLDDDDLNHLNFYADENFKDLGLSPPKKRQRGDDADEDDVETQQPKPKKQKNVFSIE